MPVIIERANWPLWLGEDDGDPATLLQPAAEDVLAVLAGGQEGRERPERWAGADRAHRPGRSAAFVVALR